MFRHFLYEYHLKISKSNRNFGRTRWGVSLIPAVFSGNNVNENERRRGVSINSPLAREHFERRRLAWRDSDEARAVISHRVGVLKENKDGGRVITVPQLNEH